MKNELKKTKNYFRCIGNVYEKALKREPCKVKLWKDGKEEGTVDGERIMGRVSVKTAKGVHTFDVYNALRSDAEEYLNSLKDDADIKRFKRQMSYFHMFEEMMNWTPTIGDDAGDEPTLVNIEGTVGINDYVNQQGEVSTNLRWNVRSANTKVAPDAATGTTLNATLYIDSVKREERNDEETGRLKVILYGADNHGACFPVSAIVPEKIKDAEGKILELADVFEDCYEVGMTVPFEFELTAHHVGGANKGGKKKFGKSGDVAVNEGFDVTELLLVGGDDEIEEPEELVIEDENGNETEVKTDWINPDTLKIAKKERARMLDDLKKNPPKKGEKTNAGSALAAKKASMKSGMKSKNTATDFDDFGDDLPF